MLRVFIFGLDDFICCQCFWATGKQHGWLVTISIKFLMVHAIRVVTGNLGRENTLLRTNMASYRIPIFNRKYPLIHGGVSSVWIRNFWRNSCLRQVPGLPSFRLICQGEFQKITNCWAIEGCSFTVGKFSLRFFDEKCINIFPRNNHRVLSEGNLPNHLRKGMRNASIP